MGFLYSPKETGFAIYPRRSDLFQGFQQIIRDPLFVITNEGNCSGNTDGSNTFVRGEQSLLSLFLEMKSNNGPDLVRN